jgi:hypothetical protein
MKNSLGLGCLILAMATAACDQASPTAVASDVPEASVATSPDLNGAGQLVVSELRGDVMILPFPGMNGLVVALDGGEAVTPDGTADRLFRLQRSQTAMYGSQGNGAAGSAAIAPGGTHLRNALLRFNGRSLQIQHPEFSAVLALRDYVLPPGAPAIRWIGFGLSQSRGQWPMTVGGLTEAAKRGFVCGSGGASAATGKDEGVTIKGDGDTGEDQRCSSGGVGATSCSGRDCSVSCMAGYYACCNLELLGACKCYKMPESA